MNEETISACTLAVVARLPRLNREWWIRLWWLYYFVVLSTTTVDKFRRVAEQVKQASSTRSVTTTTILIGDNHNGHNEDHNVEEVSQRPTGPAVA